MKMSLNLKILVKIRMQFHIKISKNITVKDENYEIIGEVIDQSDKVFIEIEGRTILAKKWKI